MFFSDEYLSETEKIDRIYKMLRAERRGRIFRLIVKLALLGLIVYGYYYLTLPVHADVRKKITDTVQQKVMELILPMVGSMVQDLTQSMQVPGQTSTSGKAKLPANITPEMIRAVQDAMKKK
ncbi:MAG: hypothetical protein PHH16_00650 [Candidatus Gracilibacteria bacterium]|nr:hypothetical protein [Candidatus Gracilibacteria bacterium]